MPTPWSAVGTPVRPSAPSASPTTSSGTCPPVAAPGLNSLKAGACPPWRPLTTSTFNSPPPACPSNPSRGRELVGRVDLGQPAVGAAADGAVQPDLAAGRAPRA